MKKNQYSEPAIKQQLIAIYENVKETVRKHEGQSRAGLMLGLQEIGSTQNGFIGAYYPISSNIIIVNKTPLRRINETKPTLFEPYGFHILLHEYIHALGYHNEQETRRKTYEISNKAFGETHPITELSTNITKYFPNLVYAIQGWIPTPSNLPIELVYGFDQSNINQYIT
jgi:hypothetical protein